MVMVSGRTRLLRVRVGAWLCPRSARPASRASWAPGPSSTRGRTRRARPTRSRSGPHRRCRRSRRPWRKGVCRRASARWRPGRQRSRELGRAPAPARPTAGAPLHGAPHFRAEAPGPVFLDPRRAGAMQQRPRRPHSSRAYRNLARGSAPASAPRLTKRPSARKVSPTARRSRLPGSTTPRSGRNRSGASGGASGSGYSRRTDLQSRRRSHRPSRDFWPPPICVIAS